MAPTSGATSSAGVDLIRRTTGERRPRPHLAAAAAQRRHEVRQDHRRRGVARPGSARARTSSASTGCRPTTTRWPTGCCGSRTRPLAEVRAVIDEHNEAPERRTGQRALARELTELVHGTAAAEAADAAADVLFGGDPTAASEQTLETVARRGADHRAGERPPPRPRRPARHHGARQLDAARRGACSNSAASAPTGCSSPPVTRSTPWRCCTSGSCCCARASTHTTWSRSPRGDRSHWVVQVRG